MGSKDIISKTVLQELAIEIANLLLQLGVEPDGTEVLEVEADAFEKLDTERQRVEARRADMVVRMHDRKTGDPFILHLEVQSSNDSTMPVRMLRYFTDIRLGYPDEPVRQYLIYIGKARLNMPDGLENPGLSYRYGMLDMHTVDCAAMMTMDKPESLVLAILCDFKGRPGQDVVNSILTRLEELVGDDEAKFRNYYYMLEVLATNRNLLDELNEAKTMLSKVDVTKLPSYQWGVDAGREEGREEIALRMISKGKMDDEDIAELTGLPVEQVQTLRKQQTH